MMVEIILILKIKYFWWLHLVLLYIYIYSNTHVDSIPPLWRVHIGIYGGVKSKHYLYK